MRTIIFTIITFALATSARAQFPPAGGGCVDGRCPIVVAPQARSTPPAPSAVPTIDASAIVRVTNVLGSARMLGSGTLVDAHAEAGLVLTCAHLFREGKGAISVSFAKGTTHPARLAKLDAASDLAALVIGAPGVEPVEIAETFPRPGDPLVSCGYGPDGTLFCNRGAALGYLTALGAHESETLELSGMARQGDSGGPVFNSQKQLVAVIFGTNGRVVDGTFCGRVRRFLAGLSPRFAARQPSGPGNSPAAPSPPQVTIHPPAQPPSDEAEKLRTELERERGIASVLRSRLDEALRKAADAAQAQLESPAADALEKAAQAKGAAWLTGLLVSLGLPGGIAGLAAGAGVWLVMRRGKKRLQARLDRLQRSSVGTAAVETGSAADVSSPPVERHHNQYVPYEVSTLDRAWAAAHAQVGQKYPGAVAYLKIAEGVKDQILAGRE